MALVNSHGGCGEPIDPTIKEVEVDLLMHDHYTAAVFQSGLMLAEIYLPRFKSQGGSSLAEFEGQTLTLSLEETS